MSRTIVPDKDYSYADWIGIFAKGASENASELGLTNEQVEELTLAADEFKQAMTDLDLAKNYLRSRTVVKNESREKSEKLFRNIARLINANADIAPEFKALVGISTNGVASGVLVSPSDLVVNGYETGVNRLRWSPNGNAPGTMYLIEARVGSEGDWHMIAFTGARKFVHKNQIPGVQVLYRVTAQRADKRSSISNVAIVYGDTRRASVSLKQAA